jgi:sRNA-binding protein
MTATRVCALEGCDEPVLGRRDARFCKRAHKQLDQARRRRAAEREARRAAPVLPETEPLAPEPEAAAPERPENRSFSMDGLMDELRRLDAAAEQRDRDAFGPTRRTRPRPHADGVLV